MNIVSRKGQKIFSGHKSGGCPRCSGDGELSSTTYRGNGGISKLCCIDCEPIILERRKQAVLRVSIWRKQQPDIKQRRAAEAVKYNSKPEVRDKVRFRRRANYAQKKEYLTKYVRDYRKSNPYINRAAAARHRALIRQRLPTWADLKAIKGFYKACPDGMVVDHIIPLKGNNVSGLHVHNNLQYLTAVENGKKSNKFEGIINVQGVA